MAVLPDNDRKAVWAAAMRKLSDDRETVVGVTKADLRAAVDAIDNWVDTNAAAFNAAAFNAAIPQPARGALTAHQKAELLMFVVAKRWEVS